YQLIANLGSGSSGIVEKVKHVQTGQIYARKRIPLRMIQRKSEAVRKRAQDEIQVMKILSGHDHIVSVVGSYQTDRHLSILIYPVADEDLASFLDRVEGSRDVSKEHEDILSRSFGCLASGLAFMHQRHIRHGDIKPSNILLHQGHILYADFGIARDTSLLDQNRTTGHPGQFTKRYAPPEVFDYMPRGRSADVFSLGCVYVEILA
ncbi:kinase-like domain-containing protein, partial [Lophiotrema nucula]